MEKYAKKIEELLKNYLMQRSHTDSGRLLKSIKVTLVPDKLGFLQPKISALDYIQFLENGLFLSKFFDLPAVNQVMADLLEAQLLELL